MIRHVKVVMLAALLACMAATALLNEFSIDWYPPAAQQADGQWVHYRASDVRVCMGARLLASVGDPSSQRHWFGCANALWKANALDAFGWRYWALISTSGLTLLAAFGFALAVRFGRMPFRVVRGRRLLTGKEAELSFKLAARREASHSGIGLDLIPEPAVSFERETRHWLIWGSVGAGKTQTMTHLVLGAIARGDGVLVIDVKGDMTEKLPGAPLLIAPQDARELANRLIPVSQDPMWSESAREILVVCLATLMATKGVDWTWSDLHKIGTSSAGTLAAMARDHHIDAIRLLENQDSRTTQSALSTFQTHMNVVATLAEAWTGVDIEREVQTPTADEAACRRYFDSNRRRFSSAALYEVRHILFAAAKDDGAARRQAGEQARAAISQLSHDPARFSDLAAALSACPSGKTGGSLGQIGPRQTGR